MSHPGESTTEPQAIAELRIDASALPQGVTRVTIDNGTITQELSVNPVTGNFDGTLFLVAGTYSLVARAFAGDVLVGESRPTSVTVQVGAVTRVLMRILDLTDEAPPQFGPIFDSLTFPTTTEASTAVTFALSVIAPGGDPVSYAWSSSCLDSTFSAPSAATTTWSKPTPGGCTIQAIATSNGQSVFQSFSIVVFPAGAASGAAEVTTAFINKPQIQLFLDGVGCFLSSGSGTGISCPAMLTSPAVTPYAASVTSWGGGTPGTVEISDDCGGRLGVEQRSQDSVSGAWLPPVAGGLCKLRVRAVGSEGVAATATIALLTRPGTPPTPLPISADAFFEDNCRLTASGASCNAVHPGVQRNVAGLASLGAGRPFEVIVTDDCVGALPPANVFFFGGGQLFYSQLWTVPALGDLPSKACHTVLHLETLEGSVVELSADYVILP